MVKIAKNPTTGTAVSVFCGLVPIIIGILIVTDIIHMEFNYTTPDEIRIETRNSLGGFVICIGAIFFITGIILGTVGINTNLHAY